MRTKKKKKITTVLIILVSIGAYVAFMFIQASNEEVVYGYTGILFGVIPALIINSVWINKKIFKKKNL